MKIVVSQRLLLIAILGAWSSLAIAANAGAEYEDFGKVVTAQEQLPADIEARIALLQAELEHQKTAASLPDKIMASLGISSANERVRELVSLADDEWALREQLLKRQKKNRLQLFLNRYNEQIKMALIAAAVAGVGGVTAHKILAKNKANKVERFSGNAQRVVGAMQLNKAMKNLVNGRVKGRGAFEKGVTAKNIIAKLKARKAAANAAKTPVA
ncbi:MAG: hypothetical protein QG604_488 [Candidatus Dependentiae bacterium]|nr:hypothetical protein [Candidatus Dependentiae bacterium]